MTTESPIALITLNKFEFFEGYVKVHWNQSGPYQEDRKLGTLEAPHADLFSALRQLIRPFVELCEFENDPQDGLIYVYGLEIKRPKDSGDLYRILGYRNLEHSEEGRKEEGPWKQRYFEAKGQDGQLITPDPATHYDKQTWELYQAAYDECVLYIRGKRHEPNQNSLGL